MQPKRKGELLIKLRVTPEQPLGNLWATAWHPWRTLKLQSGNLERPQGSLRATWKQPRSNCKETFGQPLGNKV